jgi:putative hydrolase of the HAD superfamily
VTGSVEAVLLDAVLFDAVLFDAGGVLVLPDPTVIAPLLAPYGGDQATASHCRAHYAAMAVKSTAGVGEVFWAEYDRAYVESVGVDPIHREHAARLLNITRSAQLWRWPIPDSMSALTALARERVPMGVVSNASGQIEEELLRSEICQVGEGIGIAMRCVVDSHVVGVAKPDPRIFEHALAFFPEFERGHIAYVGDSVTMDVGGATAAGLHPILLDPYDDHPGAEFERIRSLRELISRISPG